jgi:hypothetical protein
MKNTIESMLNAEMMEREFRFLENQNRIVKTALILCKEFNVKKSAVKFDSHSNIIIDIKKYADITVCDYIVYNDPKIRLVVDFDNIAFFVKTIKEWIQ